MEYILKKQEEAVLDGKTVGGKSRSGRSRKRGIEESREVHFTEEDAVEAVLLHMPPDVQGYVQKMSTREAQANFLNGFLNDKLAAVPTLKQQ